MVVSSYAGWGVAGTNVLFRPGGVLVVDNPALAAATATPPAGLQVPPPPPSFSASNGDSSWKDTVGVSVGVGGALALTAVLAGMVLWSRWVSASSACMYETLEQQIDGSYKPNFR